MRLIDADELYKKFIDGESDTEQERSANQLARYLIRHEPTVDVAPVVHGKWIYFHKQNIAVCSNCSFERNLDFNFGGAVSCPNCGAKMDL